MSEGGRNLMALLIIFSQVGRLRGRRKYKIEGKAHHQSRFPRNCRGRRRTCSLQERGERIFDDVGWAGYSAAKSPCKPRPHRLTPLFLGWKRIFFHSLKSIKCSLDSLGKTVTSQRLRVASSYRACPCSGSRIETESLLRGLCSCLSHLGRVRSPRPWTGGLFYKAGKVWRRRSWRGRGRRLSACRSVRCRSGVEKRVMVVFVCSSLCFQTQSQKDTPSSHARACIKLCDYRLHTTGFVKQDVAKRARPK